MSEETLLRVVNRRHESLYLTILDRARKPSDAQLGATVHPDQSIVFKCPHLMMSEEDDAISCLCLARHYEALRVYLLLASDDYGHTLRILPMGSDDRSPRLLLHTSLAKSTGLTVVEVLDLETASACNPKLFHWLSMGSAHLWLPPASHSTENEYPWVSHRDLDDLDTEESLGRQSPSNSVSSSDAPL